MTGNNKFFNFLGLWLPVIVWSGSIYYLSSIPDLRIEQLGGWDYILRKIAHFFEFGVLSVLLYRATGKKNIFWPMFISSVYAVSDEFHR